MSASVFKTYDPALPASPFVLLTSARWQLVVSHALRGVESGCYVLSDIDRQHRLSVDVDNTKEMFGDYVSISFTQE
jgi:hypothetical protein